MKSKSVVNLVNRYNLIINREPAEKGDYRNYYTVTLDRDRTLLWATHVLEPDKIVEVYIESNDCRHDIHQLAQVRQALKV